MFSRLAILLALLTGCLGAPERSKRSLNGTKALHSTNVSGVLKEHPFGIDYPYMIELLWGGHYCGGALITPSFVVTTRHCFPENINNFTNVARYKLLAGNQIYEDQISDFVQMRRVEKIHAHPSHKWYTDIAVIKVNKPFNLNLHVNVIRLAPFSITFNDYFNKMIVALGWGGTETASYSEYLLKVKGFINDCNLLPFQFCISVLEGKPQGGDSGGPVVIKGENTSLDLLVGLVHTISVKNEWYALNLAFFADWINETMAKMI